MATHCFYFLKVSQLKNPAVIQRAKSVTSVIIHENILVVPLRIICFVQIKNLINTNSYLYGCYALLIVRFCACCVCACMRRFVQLVCVNKEHVVCACCEIIGFLIAWCLSQHK